MQKKKALELLNVWPYFVDTIVMVWNVYQWYSLMEGRKQEGVSKMKGPISQVTLSMS